MKLQDIVITQFQLSIDDILISDVLNISKKI